MTKRKRETVCRNRRGRKPAFSIGEDRAILETWGDLISTSRSVRNKQYAQLGARALCPDGKPDSRFSWLATARKARQSVLTELGRVARTQGDEAARDVAARVCHLAEIGEISTTREAEKVIRAMRLKTSIAETVSEIESEPSCQTAATAAS
jgi:hypothetical protein